MGFEKSDTSDFVFTQPNSPPFFAFPSLLYCSAKLENDLPFSYSLRILFANSPFSDLSFKYIYLTLRVSPLSINFINPQRLSLFLIILV